GAKANYPMALDEDDHRLFVVTRRPPLLIVLDTDTGKEVARVPVGGSCDDVYFDAERKRIYALGGDGFISVIQQNDPNHYALRTYIPTSVGVRTGFFFGTSLYAGVPAAGLDRRKYGIMVCPSRVYLVRSDGDNFDRASSHQGMTDIKRPATERALPVVSAATACVVL